MPRSSDAELRRKMAELSRLGKTAKQRNRVAGRHLGQSYQVQRKKSADAKTLHELAEKEIRQQIRSRDPIQRREAAKLALELDRGKFANQVEQNLSTIVFVTIPLSPEEFEPKSRIPRDPFAAARASDYTR